MAQLFSNNAFGTIGQNLLASSTELTLVSSQGARFPAPTAGDHFMATIIGESLAGIELSWEIVRVTARSNDTLTLVRGQEGTTAATWPFGTRVELRLTSGGLARFPQFTDAGLLGLGTGTPTALLDVNSDTLRLRTARTPASGSAPGNQGDICWDAGHVYVCVATNTWKRTNIHAL
jgi:hypothetical protein